MKHAWKSLAALSVIALAACSQKTQNQAGNTFGNAENAVSNAAASTSNAVGNAVSNASLALTPTPSPQEFVDKAAKSDAYEIAAAKLAATNASSADVKDFAKMMIAGHTDSTAKIKKAAAAASPAIKPNPALTDDQNSKIEKLRGLKGADFDKEYMDQQVDAHDDALDLMKKYAADGEAATLKTAAGEIAPVVQTHLDRAKQIKDKL